MSIMNKLTRKHMQTNKKRTLVTVLGIIISVAMFTAVTTGSASVKNLFQRIEMMNSGQWHVEYQNVTKDLSSEIEQDGNTETIALFEYSGYSLFPESIKEDKPYLYLMGMDSKGFDMMNVKLASGRLPENESEILVSDHLLDFVEKPYTLGDTIEANLGQRFACSKEGEKVYLSQEDWYQNGEDAEEEQFEANGKKLKLTIVGIMESPNFEYQYGPAFTIINGLSEDEAVTYTARVFVDHVDKNIYKDSKSLAKKLSIEPVTFNNSLLKYYGVSVDNSYNSMITYLEIILIIIIMVGSVSLIYNSFAISISERTKQFGMLSSVGATKRQKMSAVLYEGFLSGCFSIPLGVTAGLLGIRVTFWVINPMLTSAFQMDLPLDMVISQEAIVIAVIVSIVTILISAYLPARKASKISAMEAIRQQKDIKISRKTLKTNKLNRKLFGLEGDLALKNLKRNKKRYRVIVFSLVLSVVLFISVSAYTHYLTSAVQLTAEVNEGDVVIDGLTYEEVKTVQPYLMEQETLSDVMVRYDFSLGYELSNQDSLNYSTKEWKNIRGKEDEQMDLRVFALNDSAFQQYANENGIDITSQAEDIISAIIINRQRDYIQYTITDMVPVEIKSETVLHASVKLTEEMVEEVTKEIADFNVLGTTKEPPLGLNYSASNSYIQLVIAESSIPLLPTIVGDGNIVEHTKISCNTSKLEGISERIEDIINAVLPNSEAFIYSGGEQTLRSQQIVSVFNVFAYGFITLITLISIANMCNTISTSFAVRRREFAMLKSVGMTPSAFKRMIVFESLLYGIKALIFGLPLGVVFNYFIYKAVNSNFTTDYSFPYSAYVFATIGVFLVVSVAMLYSTSKTRKDNIIEGLKSEIV